MKLAWISPVNKHCGISLYSHEYCHILSKMTSLHHIDIDNFFDYSEKQYEMLNSFDIIHFQYETSYFLKSRNKIFQHFYKKITTPIVLTLHEVYDSFPGVFPRSQIKGSGLTRKIKEKFYDTQHPYQTVFTQHISHNFYADKILVHAHYHKEILIKKGLPEEMITIHHHPVKKLYDSPPPPSLASDTLKLGSLGFINQNYNYTLLFNVLEHLPNPWHFTWIGGIRREEDKQLHISIQHEIINRKWEKKFTITGWVDEYTRNELLNNIDIYLAFFSTRSVSGSLATALSSYKIILATEIPYTTELIRNYPVLTIVSSDYKDIIDKIQSIHVDRDLKKSLHNEIARYITLHSYDKLSLDLLDIYQGLMV